MPPALSRTQQPSLRDYRLQDRLGAGPSGEVFRAHDPARGHDVALKLFHPHLCTPHAFGRYARATTLAAATADTTAVQMLALVAADARPFAALELAPGTSLDALVRARGRLAWPYARTLFARCAAALSAAHRAGLVHAALKPGNIVVDDDAAGAPTPHILDYGIAVLAPPAVAGATRVHTAHSIDYQAPEQLRGEPATAATDLYALGVLLFEALTGQLPFQGRPQEVAHHHIRTPPPSPRVLTPDLPADAEAIVLGLLSKSPAAREHAAAALQHGPPEPHGFEEEQATTTWSRDDIVPASTAPQTRWLPRPDLQPPPPTGDETVVLPPMPAAAPGRAGESTIIIEGMQHKEFLVDSSRPETTSVHKNATVFVDRAALARHTTPTTTTPASTPPPWRRWLSGPWTLERKLITINVAFGTLILVAVVTLLTR